MPSVAVISTGYIHNSKRCRVKNRRWPAGPNLGICPDFLQEQPCSASSIPWYNETNSHRRRSVIQWKNSPRSYTREESWWIIDGSITAMDPRTWAKHTHPCTSWDLYRLQRAHDAPCTARGTQQPAASPAARAQRRPLYYPPAGRAFANHHRANLRAARVAEDSEGSWAKSTAQGSIWVIELPRIGGCGARLIMARPAAMMHMPWTHGRDNTAALRFSAKGDVFFFFFVSALCMCA
jgi:hypothetical protein